MAKRHTSGLRPSTRPPPAKLTRPGPAQNQLLVSLPSDTFARIEATLEIVPLKLKRVIHKAGEPIQHVYFPVEGFCSVLTVLEDGEMVEVATIGREGMVGASAVLTTTPPASVAMVQGEAATCYRMPIDAFRREMDRGGPFHDRLMHYAHALIGVVMQSTACNAVHSVEQRLARWLLTAQDRMESNEFPLTQEFVAMMLGATRPTVTVVAGVLQKAGLITYHRGHVTILDRGRLERASCECHRTTANLLRAVISA